MNLLRQMTMNAVRGARITPASEPQKNIDISREEVMEVSLRLTRLLPSDSAMTLWVGPGSHADLRNCADDPELSLRNVKNSIVVALELQQRPVQMHPLCPEGGFYLKLTDKKTNQLKWMKV